MTTYNPSPPINVVVVPKYTTKFSEGKKVCQQRARPNTGVERISQEKLRSTPGKCCLNKLVRKEF
jgi:hypothetical protein